jgi:succinyl-diaminopimelate desuccinylase
MKTSLAAMVVALEDTIGTAPPSGTVSLLITSDEEGDAIHGTRHAVDVLAARGVRPDFCVVGEPSSNDTVGDVVRCGRRGSLNGTLTVRGKQGHVAYPHLAHNPIHALLPALEELAKTQWDRGDEYYPPTSFQMSNLNAGTGASNVIPGQAIVQFNFRFNTHQSVGGLQQAVQRVFAGHQLDFAIAWQHSGDPFLTRPGALTAAVTSAVHAECGIEPELSTSGGTSDGRFIAPWTDPGSQSVQVVELGPTNASIHMVDESIGLDELAPLARIYRRIIEALT